MQQEPDLCIGHTQSIVHYSIVLLLIITATHNAYKYNSNIDLYSVLVLKTFRIIVFPATKFFLVNNIHGQQLTFCNTVDVVGFVLSNFLHFVLLIALIEQTVCFASTSNALIISGNNDSTQARKVP